MWCTAEKTAKEEDGRGRDGGGGDVSKFREDADKLQRELEEKG